MKIKKPLPQPSTDALQHSEKLTQRICEEIEHRGGSISFRHYMEMALYEPALGYYVAGKRKLGKGGDFITAPEVSPLFSQCVANQCIQIIEKVQHADILEFGAGSGTMAADILLHLEAKECLPDHYYILDVSPELKALQKETLSQSCPHLLPRVTWLSALPEQPFTGVILANEVLDAMPVELFMMHQHQTYQQRVSFEDGQFKLINQSINETNPIRKAVDHLALDGSIDSESKYQSEFNPNIDNWIQQLNDCLEQGLVLLIDYGYTRSEYYHPEREAGTLICHYQHLVHNDFFWFPGLQDITANVDFTHVAEAANKTANSTADVNEESIAGCANGLTVSGFTSQAAFLTGCGLEELFINKLTQYPEQQYPLAQQVRTLSLPSEMGERFKVIALTKAFDDDLIGFSAMDFRHKL
ncbi:MAG TPA: hypothetical protein ENI84_00185 [Thiothrix sp.]|nr:hypothetical protein [Thiothrix sp.]